MPQDTPSLQEVLLRKAESIGQYNYPNPKLGEMPLSPGSTAAIASKLGGVAKDALFQGGPTNYIKKLMTGGYDPENSTQDAESLNRARMRLHDYTHEQMPRNAIYSALGYGYNKLIAPRLHERGLPAGPFEAVEKPWFKYKVGQMTGFPEFLNPNPMTKP